MVLWFFKFNGIVRIRAPRLELVVSCGSCFRKSLELNLKRTPFLQQTESLKLGNITCVTSSVLAGAYSITWSVKKNRERPQIFKDYNIIIIVMDMVITIIFNVIAIVIVVVYVNVDLTVIIIVIITLFSTSVQLLNSIRGCYEIQQTSCFEAQVTSNKKWTLEVEIDNENFYFKQKFSVVFFNFLGSETRLCSFSMVGLGSLQSAMRHRVQTEDSDCDIPTNERRKRMSPTYRKQRMFYKTLWRQRIR